jgi:hypothetical protein
MERGLTLSRWIPNMIPLHMPSPSQAELHNVYTIAVDTRVRLAAG